MRVKYRIKSRQNSLWKSLNEILCIVIRNTNWNDYKNDAGKAQSIFTTMCYLFRIEADTYLCDTTLNCLYSDYIDGVYNISFETFENHMIENII